VSLPSNDGRDASDSPTPRELLDIGQRAATQAAELLVDGLDRVRAVVETKTSSTDMVTEMDRAAERLIVETILGARPNDSIVGEEGTAEVGSSAVAWIVDPLDGTTNYLYGHPGFAVSIAATVHGEVCAATVLDPLHGDLFTATSGGGSRRNGTPIQASDQSTLAHALVATGFGYDPDRRRRQARVLVDLLPTVRDIRRMGAAAVDLCSVACGRVDAFFERGLAAWDYAAGALVASEAGARVGDLDGGGPSERFTLAAAPGVFEALRDELARAGAADT
jgi:myo-inositol-1(or 4)-monophosphatase